jgi:rhodanese-related sulfurtransferase
VSLFGEVKNAYITQEMLDSKMKIIDVRTPPEWRETGLLKGAIPIMFFDQKGNVDVNTFLKELNEKIDTKQTFAIICHTGNRTSMISKWLSKNLNYNVINILGGMDYATKNLKLKTVPYK